MTQVAKVLLELILERLKRFLTEYVHEEGKMKAENQVHGRCQNVAGMQQHWRSHPVGTEQTKATQPCRKHQYHYDTSITEVSK